MAYEDLFSAVPAKSWMPQQPSLKQFPYAQTTRNQPMRRTPAQMYGSIPTPTAPKPAYVPTTKGATPVYEPLSFNQANTFAGLNPASYAPATAMEPYSLTQQNLFAGLDPAAYSGNTPAASGGFMEGLNALLGEGKQAWDTNKNWLIGDKEQAGLLPVGLGIFNAFNQYAAGKAGIKSMQEQNALAREAFNLNKTGALADYEDQTAKRARQEFLTKNPNATPAEIYAAAAPVTEERMKRFK